MQFKKLNVPFFKAVPEERYHELAEVCGVVCVVCVCCVWCDMRCVVSCVLCVLCGVCMCVSSLYVCGCV